MSGLTKSLAGSINSPQGNALAVFINAADGLLYAKDVNGVIAPFSEIYPNNSATIIELDKNALDVLISDNLLKPGNLYQISNIDTPLYGGTMAWFTALTTNKLSEYGNALFYTPKYDLSAVSTGYGIWTKYMEGSFSNISGSFEFGETVTAQNGASAIYLSEGFLDYLSGDWSAATEIGGNSGTCEVSGFNSPIYNDNQIVYWGGKVWKNANGQVGNFIDKYTLNSEWIEVEITDENYNTHIDEIQYDYLNDMIIYRKDRYNNIVSGNNQFFVECESPNGYDYGNPIKDFQWGNAQDNFNTDDYFEIGVQQNQIINSYFDCLNSLAKQTWLNKLSNKCFIVQNLFSKTSIINNNILQNFSEIKNNVLVFDSTIQSCLLDNISNITSNNLNLSGFNSNLISNNSNINFNTLLNSNITENTLNSNSFIAGNNIINNSNISFNLLMSKCSITNNILNNSSQISINNLSNESTIVYTQIDAVEISYNFIANNSNFVFDTTIPTTKIIRNVICNAFNLNSQVLDLTEATQIFNEISSKNLFQNSNGINKMSYYNDLDNLIVGDINV